MYRQLKTGELDLCERTVVLQARVPLDLKYSILDKPEIPGRAVFLCRPSRKHRYDEKGVKGVRKCPQGTHAGLLQYPQASLIVYSPLAILDLQNPILSCPWIRVVYPRKPGPRDRAFALSGQYGT